MGSYENAKAYMVSKLSLRKKQYMTKWPMCLFSLCWKWQCPGDFFSFAQNVLQFYSATFKHIKQFDWNCQYKKNVKHECVGARRFQDAIHFHESFNSITKNIYDICITYDIYE